MKPTYFVCIFCCLLAGAACADDTQSKSGLDAGQDARAQEDGAGEDDVGSGADVAQNDADNPDDTAPDADTPGPDGPGVFIAGCRIFPADNPWNQDVSNLPLHPRAAQILAEMNPGQRLHPDWGNWSTDHYGIPWMSGTGAQANPITWTTSWGEAESDPMPCDGGEFCYPIPADARIEGGPGAPTGADRHVLYLDTAGAPDACTLYELYMAQNYADGHWTAGNGAIFNLGTNALRPDGWTSADAAGLPILPGLVRVEEVLAGELNHALRFTVRRSAKAYIPPATHAAGRDGEDLPPMGLRLRLRADYPVDSAPASAQVILRAMQTYGIILADNGSDWFITGDSDDRWEPLMDDVISGLRAVRGSDFEVLDTGAAIAQ